MLGSAQDAEDVLQDAFLKWEKTDPEMIETPRAYLSTIVTRLSIDQLRKAQKMRETYDGDWLPAPWCTESKGPDYTAELADSLSTAFLVMLEKLAPPERAAFLLKEVLDQPYAEIAHILEKSEANCRQMVKRAKDRISGERTRFEVDPDEHEKLVNRFVEASALQDYDQFVSLLADDAVFYTDHGGKAQANKRPIFGADKIVRFLFGLQRRFLPEDFSMKLVELNGLIGLANFDGETLDSVVTFDIQDGKIQQIFSIRNPDKLSQIEV
jgi:RNA polymerase sigma-70 factor (ECF subfamily)